MAKQTVSKKQLELLVKAVEQDRNYHKKEFFFMRDKYQDIVQKYNAREKELSLLRKAFEGSSELALHYTKQGTGY